MLSKTRKRLSLEVHGCEYEDQVWRRFAIQRLMYSSYGSVSTYNCRVASAKSQRLPGHRNR